MTYKQNSSLFTPVRVFHNFPALFLSLGITESLRVMGTLMRENFNAVQALETPTQKEHSSVLLA